jgi:membrane-associated protease RseP (regulator of RpoE activity)
MAESEAARARMAARRGGPAQLDDDPTAEYPTVRVPARRSLRAVLAGAFAAMVAAIAAAWHRIARGERQQAGAPDRLRTRLILIALASALIGAGAMIGIEAGTGGGGTAAAQTTSRPYLGVEVGPSLFGQPGALVEFVEPGSPAAAAGVMPGDVITSVGGQAVASPQAAVNAIAAQRPGATVVLGLDRFGQTITVTVKLGSRTGTGVP